PLFSPLPSRQETPVQSQYPLIPVAPPSHHQYQPLFSPEPEAPMSSTPVNPHRYKPLYKQRAEPMFPPLLRVDRPTDAHLDGFYESHRPTYSVVPGYNAVGSILRSMKMQRH
ncbi:hypothetical protein PoB_000656100, partial [Plakobranchus ocellatus]